jgi:hypothetical protein
MQSRIQVLGKAAQALRSSFWEPPKTVQALHRLFPGREEIAHVLHTKFWEPKKTVQLLRRRSWKPGQTAHRLHGCFEELGKLARDACRCV